MQISRMGVIVGNILWLLGLGSSFLSAAVTLKLLDEDDHVLKQVQVGRPFYLEVVLVGGSKLDEAPHIEGLNQFSLGEQSWRYEMINGATTIKYRYAVTAKKQGIFTVGPALVKTGKKQEVSNSLNVIVSNQAVHDEKSSDNASPFIRLTSSKDTLCKGERATIQLRFYYAGSVKLRNFIEQESSDFDRKKARGPRYDNETIDGVPYNFIELEWDVYPRTAGMLTIPAYGAEFEQEAKRDHAWRGIARFFGAFTETKRVYSNALSLNVVDLPATDKHIQAVGTVDSFSLTAQPSVVKQGEGIIVTLKLTGDFDSDTVKVPALKGISKDMRYYESKESVERGDAAGKVSKQMEYVLQGIEPGNFTIPVQTFEYFDVQNQTYKTIMTDPVDIVIEQAPVSQAHTFNGPEMISQKDPLMTVYCQAIQEPYAIPWSIFFLVIFAPVIWIFVEYMRHKVDAYQKKYAPKNRARYAFDVAYNALKQAKKEQKPEHLYALFISLFADKWHMPIASITDCSIADRLERCSLTHQQKAQWGVFFSTVSEMAFGVRDKKIDINHLFEQANQWLDILKASL